MAARKLEIAVLGNLRDLETQLIRSGVVAEDASKKIQGSAKSAGEAAGLQAKEMGASADAQAAAAGRASAAYVEMASKISRSQKAAGDAAVQSARATGAAVDEQRAAYTRAMATQAEYEASTKRVAAAEAEAAKKSEALQASVAGAGKWAAVGLVAAGAAAVDLGMKFQTSTASIAANAGVSQAAADRIGKAFLDTAGKSIFSGQAMSDSFASVAGQLKITEGHALSAADALKVETAAGNLAEATHASLAVSTAAVAQTMQAYHLSVNQASTASDVLFNVSKALNVPVDQVATSMSKLHARLGEAAPSLKDTSTIMVALGQQGLTGSRGMLLASTAMSTLLSSSKPVTAVLKAMGVHVYDSSGKFVGMQSVISQMQPKLAAMTEQQRLFAEKTVFGAGASKIMGSVIADGIPAWKQAADGASKAGSAQQGANLQSKTLHDQIEKLKATVSDLGTKFGLVLIPKLEATGVAISGVVTWMGKHKTAAEVLAGVIAGVLGLAITVFAYTTAAKFVGATGNMITGISALATRVGVKTGLIAADTATMAAEVATADGAIETSNVAAGASFTALGGEAAAGAVVAEGQMALFATDVAAADTAVEAANVAAGLSFTAMLGPIGLVVAGVGAATAGTVALINATGGLTSAQQNFNSTAGQGSGSQPTGVGGPTGAPGSPQGGSSAAAGGSGGGVLGAAVAAAGAGSTSGSIPVPTKGSNWQRIAGALAGQGFSNTTIAGILGNFAQETGGGTIQGINTADSGTGASGMGGMGLANWTAGRRLSEMSYAKQHGESATSLTAQVGYLVQELRGGYSGAYKATAAAGSPAQAASVFNSLFEKGSDPNGVRESAAVAAFKALTGSGSPTAGGTSGSGNSGIASLIAGASSGTTAKPKPTNAPYINPFDGSWTTTRTDQGLDATPHVAAAIKAIGAGIIKTATNNSGWPGGGLVTETLTSGPQAGKTIYVAEGLRTGMHSGQRVAAGQTIGTAVAGYGTEWGYYDQGAMHPLNNINAQGPHKGQKYSTAAGWDGTPTYGGLDFTAFVRQLQKGTAGTPGAQTGVSSGTQMTTAINTFIASIVKGANTLLTAMDNAAQSGTLKSLSGVLGYSTAGKTADQLHSMIGGIDSGKVLSDIAAGNAPSSIDALATDTPGGKDTAGFAAKITASLSKIHGSALTKLDGLLGEKHGTAMTKLVADLSALHGKSLTKIEGKLATTKTLVPLEHLLKAGPATLPTTVSLLNQSVNASPQGQAFNQQIIALDAAGQKSLAAQLVAAHKTAMLTLAEELYAEQVTKDGEMLALQATQLKDQTTLQTNTDAQTLTVTKAQQQAVIDQLTAQTTYVGDMSKTVTDQFSGIVQAIQDATQAMADNSDAIVSGIHDTTQERVDILGEKGLYGLNLIAQQETVQLDVMKAGFDQQIAAAKLNLDVVTATAHASESTAQLTVDSVTTQENQLAAMAQQQADTVTVAQNLLILAAQNHMDSVTLSQDTSVLGPAQMAVDLGATLPQSQQKVLGAILLKAQKSTDFVENQAAGTGTYKDAAGVMWTGYATVKASADAAINTASNDATTAQQTASAMIAAANATLVNVTGQANQAIASAQQTSQTLGDTAAQQEAAAQAAIDLSKAQASTQFAGTGSIVNIYGVPVENAAAIGSAVDWVARTQLSVPA